MFGYSQREPRVLLWQEHVILFSLVMNISGTKFEELCSNIENVNISKRKQIFQKGKRHSPLL